MTKKFKKGDLVLITSGRDKGMKGKISRILAKTNQVIVEGVALYKRHVKATKDLAGGIKSIERPINFSKVALLVGDQQVKVGLKRIKNKTVRINKKTGKSI